MAFKDYSGGSSTDIGANWFDLSKSDYAKVIFSDLYQNSTTVGCRFQITDNVHEDPSDYIGLFKVGYDNLTQCLVSKLLSDTECEEDGKWIHCYFSSPDLPDLDNGFYQFLYVTRDNEVCGASMPFEYKPPIVIDHSSDDDIFAEKSEDDFLVVRSTIAEQNRKLQDLVDTMTQKMVDQDAFYSTCLSKLSKEKNQLEKDIKRIREERQMQIEECKKVRDEKNNACKGNEEIIKHLERQIANLSLRIEEAYESFGDIQMERDEALKKKDEFEKTWRILKQDYKEKITLLNMLQEQLKQKQDEDLDQTAKIEHSSLLASQLDDAKLMIAALEESKLLVINEVTQLTESNTQMKENLKILRCENLALKLKLKDAETSNNKIKRKNQNLKSEINGLKLHFSGAPVFPLFCEKAENNATNAAKFVDMKLAAEEKKILNIDNISSEEESLKSQPDKIKATLVENEAVIVKLKEDCLKKDAVIEYLSKEKNTIQKISNIFEDALNDSVSRLKEAAEIYKKQYMEIENLKKKLEKAKSKCKERDFSANSSVKDEVSSSVEIKDEHVSENTKPTQNRSSDSDTGEHVLGHSTEINKKIAEAIAVVTHEDYLCEKTPSETMAADKFLEVSNENFKDVFGQSLDTTYLAIASAVSTDIPEKNRQSPELQTMIDQNLVKLSLSGSKEEEIQFSLPCPICDVDIGIYASSSEEMIKHLEIQHKQQICPICEKLFDMTLPQKYFQFHVEDHFQKGK